MSTFRDERSIAQLFGDSFSELAKLVQNEIDLARAEFGEKVSITTRAAKFVVAGTVLVIPGVVLVLFAVASEFTALGLSQPLSYLCSGLGALIIAAALIWAGRSRLSARALRPSVTLDQVRQDKVMTTEFIQ